MKKYLIFLVFALYAGAASSATVVIVNSGFTFSPAEITINGDDIIDFQLGSSHNAVEVSQSTWAANGNTPLPGFSTPFGGGQVAELTPGVHYYVCTPHASGGMKGTITVTGASGINDNTSDIPAFDLYPNPSTGKFILQYGNPGFSNGNLYDDDLQASMEIFNLSGGKIYELPGFIARVSNEIDISSLSDGVYFVRIYDRKKIYTQKLIKQ